ncbi:acyltransferase family protein [Mesorhizobium sp. PUT5]|uniref:acyltransferase family protein n=1 Tax=Mesorhizobium sp. PUT5 TaxID=3454629 RepID=UPI003FA4BB01
MKYNPALDGVRAISIIVVVAFHASLPFAQGGMIGVDIFFVLSGYLITTILRNELRSFDRIDLKRFYLRRAARLMPALVVSMAVTYTVFAVIAPDLNITWDIATALLYVSDYGAAFWGVPTYVTHTWSLSVEEHFYILWPLFLIATRNMPGRALAKLLITMFAVATAWRFVDALVWNDWVRTYYRFDTRLSGMILGGVLAVAQWRVTEDTARKFGKTGLYMLALLVVCLRWKFMPSLLIGGFLAEIATALLIVALTSGHQTSIGNAVSHPWLVRIGVLSYSIYLFHYGFAFLLRDVLDPFSTFALSFGAAFLLAAVCNHYVEKPVRSWANRARPLLSSQAKPGRIGSVPRSAGG